MKYTTLIFSAVVLVTAISCRKVIEPKDLPKQDPRLVLNCILYPDSLVSANISLSKSILTSKEYQYISDAACDLYENDSYIETLTSLGSGKYRSKLTAKANTNYSIKVAASGYAGVS